MNYARFVELREGSWKDFQERLAAARRRRARPSYEELEELALQYRQVLHDHALASWRFPGTGAAHRLAILAREGTRWVYESAEDRRGGFRRFWTRKFPLAFRRLVPYLAVSVSAFSVAALFGLFLALVQTPLATVMLGPAAVRGLESGHLWTESLVSTVPPSVSSSAIGTNNVTVAILGWAGGALGGLGSLYVVLMNGFLLGALVGVTHHYSLALRLLEFVTAHGPLEITLILVTAAAGLRIGRAMIAAGDKPRLEALREAGQESLTVLVGCAPWFLPLAVVESLVSPSPEVPAVAKLLVGLTLEALFLLVAWNPFLQEDNQ